MRGQRMHCAALLALVGLLAAGRCAERCNRPLSQRRRRCNPRSGAEGRSLSRHFGRHRTAWQGRLFEGLRLRGPRTPHAGNAGNAVSGGVDHEIVHVPVGYATGEQRGGRPRQAGRCLPATVAGTVARREGAQPAQSHVGHSELHGSARVPDGQAGGAHARTDARLLRGEASAISQRYALQLHELGHLSARPHHRGEQRPVVRSVRDGPRAETVRYEPDGVRRTRRRLHRSRARLPADPGRIQARAVVRLRSALLRGLGGIDCRRSAEVPRRRVRREVRRRRCRSGCCRKTR